MSRNSGSPPRSGSYQQPQPVAEGGGKVSVAGVHHAHCLAGKEIGTVRGTKSTRSLNGLRFLIAGR